MTYNWITQTSHKDLKMIFQPLAPVQVAISEMKKNPIEMSKHLSVCVMAYRKPVFYTVQPERYAELLKAESELSKLKGVQS